MSVAFDRAVQAIELQAFTLNRMVEELNGVDRTLDSAELNTVLQDVLTRHGFA